MNRSRIRVFVLAVVLSQIVITVPFYAGWCREPYPALILPAFDQVLAEPGDVYAYVLPRLSVTLPDGTARSVELRELRVPGVSQRNMWWVLARQAAPAGVTNWKPSLPSNNYPFGPPVQSQTLLKQLAESASQFPDDPVELRIDWQQEKFIAEAGTLKPVDSVVVGSVVVPVP